MYTLDQLQQKIHRIYQGDTDYPSSTEEDYTLRTGLINDAINDWAYNQGIYWKELFVDLADASDGDKTAVSSTEEYDPPSDFVFISSWIKITKTDGTSYYYTYAKPDEVMKIQKIDSSKRIFWITGSNTNKKIHILNPVDGTISYSYYKQTTELSSTTDKIEMSKPYFAIYSTVASLYELDNRNDMVSKYSQLAKNLMDEMIIENETKPYNNSFILEDNDYQLYGGTFGK